MEVEKSSLELLPYGGGHEESAPDSQAANGRKPIGAPRIFMETCIIVATLFKFALILRHFILIELHAKARPFGHGQTTVSVFHQSANNDIVGQITVVGVARERHLGDGTCHL